MFLVILVLRKFPGGGGGGVCEWLNLLPLLPHHLLALGTERLYPLASRRITFRFVSRLFTFGGRNISNKGARFWGRGGVFRCRSKRRHRKRGERIASWGRGWGDVTASGTSDITTRNGTRGVGGYSPHRTSGDAAATAADTDAVDNGQRGVVMPGHV